MTHDEFNPFAPPEELAVTPETRPWLFDPKNAVRIGIHKPRIFHFKQYFLLALRSLVWLAGIVPCICLGITLFIPPARVFLFGWIEELIAYEIMLFVISIAGVSCLFGTVLLFFFMIRAEILGPLRYLKTIYPQDTEDFYTVRLNLHYRKFKLARLFRHRAQLFEMDIGVLSFEEEGLRYTGDRIDLFVPWGAVSGSNAVLGASVLFDEPPSPEFSHAQFTLIPHRLRWYSGGWMKASKEFSERVVEATQRFTDH